ncbi:RNA dependent RNA polymerase-domain-containing protein [Roridomyces roridus]|uniref:RNA-dependent RNA polymerase n=1 Tax=Roridomyces roridus TaxID=1738132 RepID=A0AAD7B2S1_9AGAR|nr:RNA dependent RNA polymerase-domain-containing protein [Roridomyces roridus]
MSSPCKKNRTEHAPASSTRPRAAITPSTIVPEPSTAFPLDTLFDGTHGSALPPYIIAHSKEVQSEFETKGILLGVQWELARGVSRKQWGWADVLDKMQDFRFKKSNSEVAGKVAAMMLGRPEPDVIDLALWNEVDREHKAFVQGQGRGLGLMGPSTPYPQNWYGGQITYPLRLAKLDGAADYHITLEKPRRGRSNRFARDLGSHSVLQLSIPLDIVRYEAEELRRFLCRRFILNGRVYVAIPPKDKGSVYLVQVNQDWERTGHKYFGDLGRRSFEEFVGRHNPPSMNSKQAFAKYVARYALGLSTSMPVLEFLDENMFRIQDTVADDWPEGAGKAPSEKIMTDGCGFINRAAMVLITKHVPYSSLPTAIQARIGGAKGLWTLHPTDTDPTAPPRIWIRDSQLKIHFQPETTGMPRVHRILDLLRASHPAQAEGRVTLSEQSIMCLSYNGVPDEVFVQLMVEGLEAAVRPLLKWCEGGEGDGTMVELWRAVNGVGNVSGARKQRIAGGRSRALGYVDRERDELVPSVEEEEDVLGAADEDGRAGRDLGPLSLHEQAMELIQAGFQPRKSAYLNDKMKYIIKLEIKSVVEKYKISLPEGTAVSDAFVIPDPLGILEENQVYYRSSAPMKNVETQMLFNILKGPVIIGRYPIRLPCDMQQVEAVDVPELYDWPDVVIVSTAGSRSLLSVLSGGDYDGDTVFFTWFPPFLEHFQNRPFTDPPDNLMETYFQQDVKTVDQVGSELQNIASPVDRQIAFQDHLLAGLRESQVGQYSWFHDIAIWRHGYSHPQAILMAYIGNTLLDAAKTGLSLKPGVFEEHKRHYGHVYPKTENSWLPPTARRDEPSNPYILEKLCRAGNSMGDLFLHQHDLASKKLDNGPGIEADSQLLQSFADATQKSNKIFRASADELQKIKTHVDGVRKLYRAADKPENKHNRAALVADVCQKYMEPVPGLVGLFDNGRVEEIKASYAYSLKEKFAFTVAFRTLCEIKSRAASGGMVPTRRVFDELKSISASAARALGDLDDY